MRWHCYRQTAFSVHAAYELAEKLLNQAKQVKQQVKSPSSALDYHILYDASGADLTRIREKLWVDGETTYLVGRPYVVTAQAEPGSQADNAWLRPRVWSQLERQVEAMLARDEEDPSHRALPGGMLHELREGLFRGHEEADARMRLVRKRYPAKVFEALLSQTAGDGSLFWSERHNQKDGQSTSFLDALDVAEFWK